MTDAQFDRFDVKVEQLAREISILTSNVQVLTHRVTHIEEMEVAELKSRVSTNSSCLATLEKKIYAASAALFVAFTTLQFLAANGMLKFGH